MAAIPPAVSALLDGIQGTKNDSGDVVTEGLLAKVQTYVTLLADTSASEEAKTEALIALIFGVVALAVDAVRAVFAEV